MGKRGAVLPPGSAPSKGHGSWPGQLAVLGVGIAMVSSASLFSRWGRWAVSIGLMMQLAGLLFFRRRGGWWCGLLSVIAILVIGGLGWHWPVAFRLGDQLALYVLALCGPLLLFARSLRAGRLPLITQLAEAVHGPLRADVGRYTFYLTWFWVGFFILSLLAPLVLWGCMPQKGYWRWPLHGGTALLAVFFFFGELVARRFIIRHYAHASLKQNLMAGYTVFMRGK